jgi:RNA polymerase sigma-70 factor (ECF subfamily)
LLISVAVCVLHDRAAAEDCVHDVVLKMWNHPELYDSRRGSLKTFLIVAVRNAAITRLRNAAKRVEIERSLGPALIEDAPDIPDYIERSRLAAALRALPDEQRKALTLAYFGHLTHHEIAERLDLPLGTVKSRIALAMRRLRTALPRFEDPA